MVQIKIAATTRGRLPTAEEMLPRILGREMARWQEVVCDEHGRTVEVLPPDDSEMAEGFQNWGTLKFCCKGLRNKAYAHMGRKLPDETQGPKDPS